MGPIKVCALLTLSIQIVVTEYIVPTVDLTSCLQSTVALTITNATSGGLLYIRTDAAYNIIPTTDGTLQYSCTFDNCNIDYDEKFTVVVQRKTWVQTSDDVLASFLCLSDLDHIRPINFASSNLENSGNVTTFAYTPNVAVTFYIGDDVFLSGSEVILGTKMDMVINVTNNAHDFFDISVRSCAVSVVQLINDKCPVDEDLFQAFTKVSSGLLTNSFYMFRPTSTADDVSLVIFSCVLEVCAGNCDETNCSDTSDLNATDRRKRDIGSSKKVADFPSKYVGSTFKVISQETEKRDVHTRNPSCLSFSVFVVVVGVMSTILIASITVTVYFTLLCTTQTNDEHKRVEITKTNFGGDNEEVISNVAVIEPAEQANSLQRRRRSSITSGLGKLAIINYNSSHLAFGDLKLKLESDKDTPGIGRKSPKGSSFQYQSVEHNSPTINEKSSKFTFSKYNN